MVASHLAPERDRRSMPRLKGSAQMPVKLLVAVKRKPGMSPEEFRHRYETGHSRLGLRLFGHLWVEYRRNYITTGKPFGAGARARFEDKHREPPFDAVAELFYRDWEAMAESARIKSDPAVAREIEEDEETLFDRDNCWLLICDPVEEDLRTAVPLAGNKWVTA